MALRKLAVAFLLGILVVFLPQCSRAQFIGYTSPQTVQVQVFNNISAPAVSAPLQNIGQSAHILYYRAANARVTDLFLQASYDGTNWFAISNIGSHPAEGVLFASGYYPLVRVNASEILWSGTGGTTLSVSAWYSGTSVTPGPEAGKFHATGENIVPAARGADATISPFWLGDVPVPFRSSEGTLFFIPQGMTGVTALTDARLEITITPNPAGGVGQQVFSFGPLIGGNTVQAFAVPAYGAANIEILYEFNPAAAPDGGTYSVLYAFGPTAKPTEIEHTFIPLSAVGVTETLYVEAQHPEKHTAELTVTGAPSTCTFQLEGSLGALTWFALSDAVDCTVAANRMFHVVNKPVNFVRGDLTALAGGAAPTVTLSYLGTR